MNIKVDVYQMDAEPQQQQQPTPPKPAPHTNNRQAARTGPPKSSGPKEDPFGGAKPTNTNHNFQNDDGPNKGGRFNFRTSGAVQQRTLPQQRASTGDPFGGAPPRRTDRGRPQAQPEQPR